MRRAALAVGMLLLAGGVAVADWSGGGSSAFPATPLGHIYVSMAPPPQSGRGIPPPPVYSRAYIQALMFNGGNVWGIIGKQRPGLDVSPVQLPLSPRGGAVMRWSRERADFAAASAAPYWLALSGSRLFVSDSAGDVEIHDTSSYALLASLPSGGVVTDLAASADGRYVFAADSARHPGLMVMDVASSRAVRWIDTPRLPGDTGGLSAVAISPDCRTAYVAVSSQVAGEVAAIDTVSKAVLKICPVGRMPMGLGLSPDGRTLYCTNGAGGSVSVIDTSTLTELKRVAVDPAPLRAAVAADGSAYVTCRSGSVCHVDSTGLRARISLERPTVSPFGLNHPVPPGPTALALTPDGAHLVVSNTAAGSLSVIDTTRDQLEYTTSDQLMCRPFGVVVGP
ncbi:MAG TPA: hypothetical protein VGO93_03325 [Candidatus Xenobia bacterium]